MNNSDKHLSRFIPQNYSFMTNEVYLYGHYKNLSFSTSLQNSALNIR